MADPTSDNELRIERLIAAPPETVYAFWTEPQRLVKWWGPEGYDVPDHSLDIRQGGKWRMTMRSPDGGRHTVSGIYRELVPDRRVVFTWGWENDTGERGHETEVTVTLESTSGGTRLLLLQKTFEDKDTRDRHGIGWQSTLNHLAQALAAEQH